MRTVYFLLKISGAIHASVLCLTAFSVLLTKEAFSELVMFMKRLILNGSRDKYISKSSPISE